MGPGFFIDRPVFASVISIVILLAGFAALRATPVAQYPEVAPPTVTVTAVYPGATAEVIANTVAAPIEQQVNGVDGMIYMSSTSSSSGAMTLTVTFAPGTDPDIAQVNTQNRVSQALAQLPEVVTRQGVKVEKKSSSFMMLVSFFSEDDSIDPLFLRNYVNLYVLDAVKRQPGANLASVFPPPEVAMRVWLQPNRMAQLGVTTAEVANAIRGQNQAFGVGQIGQAPVPPGTQQNFPITSQGMLQVPAEFEDIIIRTGGPSSDAAIVRLRDVARAELGSQSYFVESKINGRNAAALVVYQQPGSNALDTSARVRALLEELSAGFPDGLEYKVVMDTSEFTAASIEKVVHTFFEAVVLVVLVVFLFLQSLRATVIPLLAVPIAIVGAYIGIYLLGFSTNMLTLFGMILAIGLVVDDAIIVVEAVEHKMATKGMSPREAAHEAMHELTGALISIVLVLAAVFVPVAFLGGMTGTLYKQFAITIAIAMVFSGIVALTLSPALSALILKRGHGEKKGFFLAFERGFERVTDYYVAGVRWLLHHRLVGIGLFLATLGAIFALFRMVPSSFVPEEDQGYIFTAVMLPDAASLERTTATSDRVTEILLDHPAIADAAQIDGFSLLDGQTRSNASAMFVALESFEERSGTGETAFTAIADLQRELATVKTGLAFAVNPPAVPGLGVTGGFDFYLQDRGGGSSEQLGQAVQAFVAAARQRPELAGVSSTYAASQQQLYLDVDRPRAELLGVPVQDVYTTLQAYFGSVFVSQFTQFGRVWQVIMQAEGEYRDDPSDLDGIYLTSREGDVVPLSAVAERRFSAGPTLLSRFNGFPAAKVTGSAAPGFSSGQALAAMEAVATEVLPEGYGYAWAGQAYEEKQAGGTSAIAFVFGIIMVFLILAAQYEKWTLPFGVLLAVPFAIFGALLLTWGRGLENDVYFQVGLVTLIGLSAKNAILITEFAVENIRNGMAPEDAAAEAARARLRPIVMTSLAFILGCVPMAIATGPGANSLHAIGTGVIGGMLASTLIASFFVPLFFVLLERGKPAAPAAGRPAPGGGPS
ncbi:multidrug efflux RND transporter permease subunit [Thioalkalivibrio sp. XN8]|uniref:efflux RND transporter permease subunit n=1 Tax=Thioalkalivibrio sp. XN8 TaxID=2712863 RepID=UPI0013ED6E63|nr:multidrug efflux RND transporter permease subunit [Thioalkalivibrio sp. XN8]NGP52355.1 multidrug efflux RND transporter permease subunit [Thioalkalivibrio sp. XN8]